MKQFLPDVLTVCGVEYDVVEVKDLHFANGEEAYGWVIHGDLLILVEETVVEEKKIQILLHEAMHALFHQTGQHDQTEERVAWMLGCQLPKFLRDNPALVALINGENIRVWGAGK